MSLPNPFRPYAAVDSQELELQPLGPGGEAAAPGATSRPKRWRLPPWEDIYQALQQPRVQGRLWLLAAVVVAVVVTGAAVASSKAAASKNRSTHSPASGPNAHSSSRSGPFPAEPWVVPAGSCTWANPTGNAGGGPLHPRLQVAVPLNYRVALQFVEDHFAAAGNSAAAVASDFQAAANITLAIQQTTSCVPLAAVNLTFSSITASLVAGTDQLQQGQPTEACLCGSGDDCVVGDCGRLFTPYPGAAAWSSNLLLSLGPLVAPAGSTLLLITLYTALFQPHTGVTRSAPFTPTHGEASGGEQQPAVLISTALEPVGARRVFPCMDEPQYKATFVILLEAPAHLSILSNMPEASRRPCSSTTDSVCVEFLPSPPMSTYLVAIAVGDMQSVSANMGSGLLVRVWSPMVSEWKAASAQPLALAVAALQHYTRYTGISQPLSKVDLVAIPGRTGAMESWGLLLFDVDRFLLTSPSAWSLFRCANVICHELAHQWFGNLVTAHTWGDLLVNEGLASLAEYGCMAQVALPSQASSVGAALLMRSVVGPHGKAAGVHEGPFAKALNYDALPSAQPLLGSANPDFGVPVYSKAAAVMAMLTMYSATARQGDMHQAALAAGPVATLVATDPPGELQVALRQYLNSRIYGSATAADVLQLFLKLTPEPMAGSAVAVLTAWEQPGSPVMTLQHTDQGLQIAQRRFCSAGFLSVEFVDKLLSSHTDSPSSVPTPPVSAAGTPSSAAGAPAAVGPGGVPGLSCPTMVDGQDRAVPWTPVLLAVLPTSQDNNTATSTAARDDSHKDDSDDYGRSSSSSHQGKKHRSRAAVCGSWQVVMRDVQLAQLPSCPAGASSAADSTDVASGQQGLLAFEGDGGWGLYTSLYPPSLRAAHRRWVGRQLLPLLSNSSTAHQPRDMRLLFAAAKLLRDQATLGLSAFQEVPAWEVLAALQVASSTSTAAAQAAAGAADAAGDNNVKPGLGTVTYALLSALLPLADVLSDRMAVNPSCWVKLQGKLAAILRPPTAAALHAFGGLTHSSSSSTASAFPAQQQYASPDQVLGAMSLSGLLTAAGLADPTTASALCKQFNAAVAAAAAGGNGGRLEQQLPPDVRDAVLNVAAAQPAGCQLDMPGEELLGLLHGLYLTAPDPATCQMAGFALAHSARRSTQDSTDWQVLVNLLVGVGPANNSAEEQADVPVQHTNAPLQQQESSTVQLACGIPVTAHAVELALIISRGVTSSWTREAAGKDPASADHQLGPVVQYVLEHFHDGAWQILEEVAALEVLNVQQWQQLAWALQRQPLLTQQLPGIQDSKQQRNRIKSLLGRAWSAVAWVERNAREVCQRL